MADFDYKRLNDELAGSRREDLGALSTLAARIDTEICAYFEELRQSEFGDAEQKSATDIPHHQINATVERISTDFEALVKATNELRGYLDRMRILSAQCELRGKEAQSWLVELERTFSSVAKPQKQEEVEPGMIHEPYRPLITGRVD